MNLELCEVLLKECHFSFPHITPVLQTLQEQQQQFDITFKYTANILKLLSGAYNKHLTSPCLLIVNGLARHIGRILSADNDIFFTLSQ